MPPSDNSDTPNHPADSFALNHADTVLTGLGPRLVAACDTDETGVAWAIADLLERHGVEPAGVREAQLQSLFGDAAFAATQTASDVLGWFRSRGYGVEQKFGGSLEQSYLPAVIRRQHGLPILLSVLLLEGLRRRGHTATGVNYPGHFLVNCGDEYFDPQSMTRVDPDNLSSAPAALETASPRMLAQRMLNNIKAAHAHAHRWPDALEVIDLQLLLARGDPATGASLHFERAEIWQQLGALAPARDAFSQCQALAPASDAARVATQRLAALDKRSQTFH